MATTPTAANIDAAAHRVLDMIREDIAAEQLPADVATYAQVREHCDERNADIYMQLAEVPEDARNAVQDRVDALLADQTPPTAAATLEVEIVKGYRTYSVKDAAGAEVARAHCVQVKLGLYTLVVGGKWSGVAAEAATVAKLRAMADAVTGPADAVAFVESCAA